MIKLITQILNLIRIQKSINPFDKSIITRLSVNPDQREAIKEWHIGRKVTGMECER